MMLHRLRRLITSHCSETCYQHTYGTFSIPVFFIPYMCKWKPENPSTRVCLLMFMFSVCSIMVWKNTDVWQHREPGYITHGRRLFKCVMANIPPRAAVLSERGAASLERKQRAESRVKWFEQLHFCYSEHMEGNEERILCCGSSQKHWTRVNQGSDCVSVQGHVIGAAFKENTFFKGTFKNRIYSIKQ